MKFQFHSRNVHKDPQISEAFYAECMRAFAVAALAVAGLGYYYAAADGPRSIWSVGLGRNGSFSNSAHN
jgi:ABC-type antimicrobial peptide transport system permease subunit